MRVELPAEALEEDLQAWIAAVGTSVVSVNPQREPCRQNRNRTLAHLQVKSRPELLQQLSEASEAASGGISPMRVVLVIDGAPSPRENNAQVAVMRNVSQIRCKAAEKHTHSHGDDTV